jgi:hypothetical protein
MTQMNALNSATAALSLVQGCNGESVGTQIGQQLGLLHRKHSVSM